MVQIRQHRTLKRLALSAVIVGLGLSPIDGGAQEREYRRVESPFQADFEYRINDELRPLVEVDGVRWIRFAVRTRDGREVVVDEENRVTVEFAITTEGEGARVHLIVLFEDGLGNPLERLACDPVKIGSGRIKEIEQKEKLPGRVLEATRRAYLYFEVTR